jgi:ERCC4-type nuclease
MSPKETASVRIVVDVHETKSGIAEMLAELGASVERASLPAGDYAVGAETMIERKRVLDLHGAVLRFTRSRVLEQRPRQGMRTAKFRPFSDRKPACFRSP